MAYALQVGSKARCRQNMGYITGAFLGLACLVVFFCPGQEKWHAKGPMNTGHENLDCQACHQPTAGTIRQQLQVNVKYLLGLRQTGVDLGHQDVENATCLSCHQRPNDRHPVSRFLEPRFATAREKIQPQSCHSCHSEHTGKRVTIEPTFCMNCHADLTLKVEKISIPHERLVAYNNWESCLGCHDFHGNHRMELKTAVEAAFESGEIRRYFDEGPSPYSELKYYDARGESSDE